MSINALSSSAPLSKPNNFKYNGKEEQTEFDLNWYDYGARNYDAQIGRMIVVDPMSEVMYGWNPYHYTFNNPVVFADPSGMKPEYYYDYDDEKYYRVNKKGKKREVSAETALASLESGTVRINTKDGIEGFMQGLNADPSKPHYFESEQKGIAFMMGISFSDNNPDENGMVQSKETSAWILSNNKTGKKKLAVMPWINNTNASSDNNYFHVFGGKDDATIYINHTGYKIVGHIHMHPHFYETYEGPSKTGGANNKGDFAMNMFPFPKYVIGRNEISKFTQPTANDHKWVWNRTTGTYINHFFLTRTANFVNGEFSFFSDVDKK